MKLTGIVTALTLGGTAALAAPDGAGMRLWDADGDGALSRGEVAAIQLDAFDTFDVNEDGDLKNAEREAFEAHMAGRPAATKAVMTIGSPDTNGDRIISAGEFRVWSDQVFDLLDQTGDGLLTRGDAVARAD